MEGKCAASTAAQPLPKALHDSLEHAVSRPGMHEADWVLTSAQLHVLLAGWGTTSQGAVAVYSHPLL